MTQQCGCGASAETRARRHGGATGSVASLPDPTTVEFTRVCRLDELPEVGAAAAEINGVRVAIAHTEDGRVHAINDICSHANVSLAEGELDGELLECWLHGSRFNLNTGEPTCLPATEPVDVYPVRIVDDEVFVAVPPSTTTN